MARGRFRMPRTMVPGAFGAQRLDFERTPEHFEIANGGASAQHLFEFGDFDITHAPALYAYDMMMRREIAVIARAVVQGRHLARLADLAQRFQRAMHGGERNMRMLAAHDLAYRIGARMLRRSEQRLDNGEALRGHREPALAASRSKLREASGGISGSPPLIDQF